MSWGRFITNVGIIADTLIVLHLSSGCYRYIEPTQIEQSQRESIEDKLLKLENIKSIQDIKPLLEDILFKVEESEIREDIFKILEKEEYKRLFDEEYRKKSLEDRGIEIPDAVYISNRWGDAIIVPKTNFITVLKGIAHEIGHLLSSKDDKTTSEVKAYAFSAMFFQYIKQNYSKIHKKYMPEILDFGPAVHAKIHFPSFIIYYEIYKRIGDAKRTWEFAKISDKKSIEELLKNPSKQNIIFPYLTNVIENRDEVEKIIKKEKFDEIIENNKIVFRNNKLVYLEELMWESIAVDYHNKNNKNTAFYYLDKIKEIPKGKYNANEIKLLLGERAGILDAIKEKSSIPFLLGNVAYIEYLISKIYYDKKDYQNAVKFVKEAIKHKPLPLYNLWNEYINHHKIK